VPSPFARVVVVFNPNSTGDAPEDAKTFRERLSDRAPDLVVELRETERAGHAEEIARDAVREVPGTLVVSASGDGGYHEVVNGLLSAIEAGARGYASVLASGNANDHASAVHLGDERDGPAKAESQGLDLVEAVALGKVKDLDVLELEVQDPSGEVTTRRAHSYVGVGITPVAARELNSHDLDAVREAFLVTRSFWRYRPLTITHGGKELKVDSLVFANIKTMGKYAQLSSGGRPDDGSFEVLLVKHRSKLRLLLAFLRILRGKHHASSRTDPYVFTAQTPMPLQLDGELTEVDARAEVTVRVLPGALPSVF
jgi:diacylglycerol kinase family enzyme